MSVSPELRNELFILMSRFQESEASAADCERMQDILTANPLAREYYIGQLFLAARLHWALGNGKPGIGVLAPRAAQGGPALPLGDSSGISLLSRLGSTTTLLGLGVIGLLLGYFVVLVTSLVWEHAHQADRLARPPETATAPAARAFVTITGSTDCQWAGDQPAASGRRLGRNTLNLASGLAELAFDDGSRVVVEGPARFEFERPGRMLLKQGRLKATVPLRAIGFTVATPMADVVDLGTEFGVEVDASGRTEVHVLQGKVKVRQNTNAARPASDLRLEAGDAVRLVAGRADERIPLARSRFVLSPRAAGASDTSDSGTASAVPEGQARGARIALERPHPGLIAYFPMNEPAGSTVASNAIAPAEKGFYMDSVNLGVPGPRPSDFPSFAATNTGAQFGAAGARLDISSLTTLSNTTYSYEVWFKYHDVLTLQYLGGRGGPGLNIDAVGLLNGTSVLFFNGDVVKFNGDPAVTADAWHHLVYTREDANVNVYLDGQIRISEVIPKTYGESTRIVAGCRPDQQLCFPGEMDELTIYNGALTADEVRLRYQATRPWAKPQHPATGRQN